MNICIMDLEDLQREIKSVFGNEYKVINVVKLIGGAQKGTFKVMCNMNFNFILYIWHKSYDNFYKYKDKHEEFTSNSAILFKKNSDILIKNKISIPQIYHMDISKSKYPFEFAFVQYIDKSDLETLMYKEQENHELIFEELQSNILRLHNITSKDVINSRNEKIICEDYINNEINKNLEYLYNNFEQLNKHKNQINEYREKLYKSINPRKKYSLIHYELGPNHVMVGKDNKVYLIDIEGAKFFDLEMEHSFLKFRYGKFYKYFDRNDLDQTRMEFYGFYHNVGALRGAHELLRNNYEDKEDIENMIKYNLSEILKIII